MYLYMTDPIDSWPGWQPAEDFKVTWQDLRKENFVQDYDALLEQATAEARRRGWQGDFRNGPYVAGLPPQDGRGGVAAFMVGWRQTADGRCFIASPYALPWLESCRVYPAA